MKKKISAISIILILMAIMVSGTLAYYTASEQAHNVITTSRIGIELVEKTKDENGAEIDFPENGIDGVMPGASVSKIVSVKNKGTADAWIRVKVEKSIQDPGGKELPLEVTVDGRIIPILSFIIDDAKWIKGNDEYYYFTQAVAPEKSTDVLFEEVHFASEMGNEYQKCTTNIVVSAQAVQAANNPIPDGGDVTDIKGWPTEVHE